MNLCDSYLMISGPLQLREQLVSDLKNSDLDFDWAPLQPQPDDRTILRLTSAYEPPEDFVSSLSDRPRYPLLTFELAYVLEFTAGGGFIQFAAGIPALHERAKGQEATLALLDRCCPQLAESQREALGE